MKRIVWLLEFFLLLVFSFPIAVLPLRVSIKAGEFLGLLLFYVWSGRRKIAIENIKRSDIRITSSEPEKIAKEHFKNLGRSFVEVLKIYYRMGGKIINSVEIEGAENIIRAKAKGKGIVFITGHCGNWELTAITISARVSRGYVVARPINNPYLNKFVENVRQKYGNGVIYKKGALRGMLKALKTGEGVGVLMDQSVLADEGYVIDFLGRGAWTTKMPALIARKTGAAVLSGFIHRTGSGHKIVISPEIELSDIDDNEKAVIEDTKRFSSHVENYIREHPTDWLWIHRRWKRVKQDNN